MSGQLWMVSAPSGTGKTSLVRALCERLSGLEVSISHTTRQPRANERDGVNYHFVTDQAFESLVAQGAFLEHAEVFGHQYGTTLAAVQQRLDAGVDVLLEIDWQGAVQVQERHPEALSVFVLPPSPDELGSRLKNRRSDTPEVIQRRLDGARVEVQQCLKFDYLIVNDDFDQALGKLACLIQAARLGRERQAQALAALLASWGL